MSRAEATAGEAGTIWSRLATLIENAVDRVSRSSAASLALIAIVALLAFLPGHFTLPPVDRDEPRFAQATHQMVETGNYLDIRLQEETRYKKPIGIYWLQSIAVWATGTGPDASIGIYRLPSLFGAIAAACLTWWLAIAFGRPRVALLAGLLVASTVLLGIEARLAKTDAVLLATILAAHGALARAWLSTSTERNLRLAAIFWTALGASILIKGPLGLAAIACPLILLSVIDGSFRWLKQLAPLPGLIWMLLVVAPWFVAIGIASKGAFFEEAVGKDLIGKVVSVQESHGAPPGAYFLLLFFTFWPAAAYLSTGISWIMDRLKQPVILYAVVSVVPYWLIVEAMPTKLPHYVLPAYPLLAIATASALDAGGIRREGWFARFAASGAALMPAPLAVAAVVIAILLGENPSVAGVLILIVAGIVGVVSGRLFIPSPIASAAVAVIAAVITYLGIFGFVLPHLQHVRISENLATAGRAALDCPDPRFTSAGYGEPSLVLLAGTDTVLTDGAGAASFLAAGDCRAAFVEKRQLPSFNERTDDLGMMVDETGTVRGYAINGGRLVEFHIFVARSATP
ncbi:glycosyl transferase [Kaistia sp. 32K]|uniref:ArnT family glycosyltransferase n=1 Tax=Kaistia sp. 32K TaxID=2795690 RepID=UPI0019160C9C|nr:glycosyltransferase family 39 protein [Kaistia sp. 32K]BCP53397.1 glycosyl transferase [Kaistia sp. 32K]